MNIAITKPVTDCLNLKLISIPSFSGTNLLLEAGASVKGAGEFSFRLKKDDENYVELGMHKEDMINLAIGSSELESYTEETLDATATYSMKRPYKHKTFTIVKKGDRFESYLNGIKQGSTLTNSSIGDDNLVLELLSNSCADDLKAVKNNIDYVYVNEPIGDGKPSEAVALLKPNGGEIITIGSLHLIEWTSPV